MQSLLSFFFVTQDLRGGLVLAPLGGAALQRCGKPVPGNRGFSR
jgi:hypothetical protein